MKTDDLYNSINSDSNDLTSAENHSTNPFIHNGTILPRGTIEDITSGDDIHEDD